MRHQYTRDQLTSHQCTTVPHPSQRMEGPSIYLHLRQRGVSQTAGCGAPVVLVHGFGASTGHYRKNITELAKKCKVSVEVQGQLRGPSGPSSDSIQSIEIDCPASIWHLQPEPAVQVYAIDLLGFGSSDKAQVDYSMELWRDQAREARGRDQAREARGRDQAREARGRRGAGSGRESEGEGHMSERSGKGHLGGIRARISRPSWRP